MPLTAPPPPCAQEKNRLNSKGRFFELDGPPLYTNMPPVSGALAWVQGLIHRLEDAMVSLIGVLSRMEDTDEVKDVRRLHDSILESLQTYERHMFCKWDGTVDGTLEDTLNLPLLVRDPKAGRITVSWTRLQPPARRSSADGTRAAPLTATAGGSSGGSSGAAATLSPAALSSPSAVAAPAGQLRPEAHKAFQGVQVLYAAEAEALGRLAGPLLADGGVPHADSRPDARAEHVQRDA